MLESLELHLIASGKKLGFSILELNEFRVGQLYELFDLFIEEEREEDRIVEADQEYYDKLFNRSEEVI